jgi:alpha-methylacyl-CoA racemase
MTRPELTGPLKGIKILDLTRLLPGPLGTQMMAEMGADVIKIEDKNSPDYARFMPPHLGDNGLVYLNVNRTKRSISLDLKSVEGKEKFFELLKTADIVIEGFRPKIIDKMGLGYDEAIKYKKDIIYVSVTGYGQDGPYMNKAGHDLNYIGYAGILGTNGYKDRPSMSGVQIADIAGGTYPLIVGCLAALWARTTNGLGQKVDISMTDCVLPLSSVILGEGMNQNTYYSRAQHPLSGGIPNYNIYQCKDKKWLALGTLEPKFWMGFCALINKQDWAMQMMDPKMFEELTNLFLTKDRDEWIEQAKDADICLSPIYEQNEVEHDPQLCHRNMFIETHHPKYGKLRGIAQPFKFSATPCNTVWASPLLGEDND